MDHLWTPWRFQHVSSSHLESECVFCRLLSEQQDRQNLILLRKKNSYLLLNRYPYTTGHLLVVTRRHIATLTEASPEELVEIIQLASCCENVLFRAYQPDGFNVGCNLGKSAGAGVVGHLHLHMVPRWEGDANFVSVVGETRLVPEDLQQTYDKLLPYFSE